MDRLASKVPASPSIKLFACWPMGTRLRSYLKSILHSSGKMSWPASIMPQSTEYERHHNQGHPKHSAILYIGGLPEDTVVIL